MQASSNGETRPVVKSTTQARQGVTGHNVRYVLFVGTALAIVALGILWFAFFR
jgi:hypothetical protein